MQDSVVMRPRQASASLSQEYSSAANPGDSRFTEDLSARAFAGQLPVTSLPQYGSQPAFGDAIVGEYHLTSQAQWLDPLHYADGSHLEDALRVQAQQLSRRDPLTMGASASAIQGASGDSGRLEVSCNKQIALQRRLL